MTLNELSAKAHKASKEKGWYPQEGRNIGELIALIHSEISESLEEARDGNLDIYYKPDSKGNKKPEGFPIEIADAVIRIADLCGYLKIDLEKAIKIKMKYNETREHRHGGKVF